MQSAVSSARSKAEGLARQKNRSKHAGGAEWTAEQEDQLVVARGELSEAMATIAREMIAPHLDGFLRPRCTEAPGRFAADTPKNLLKRLQTAMKVVDEGGQSKKLKQAKAELKAWADYRRQVAKAESVGASRVHSLFVYWGHALTAGDAETAEKLAGCLRRNWGHRGDIPDDIDAASTRLARRRDLISDELLLLGRPTSEVATEPERIENEPAQICAGEVV